MGYCVYRHIAPNGKIYIGLTGGKPQKRWRNGKGYYQNAHFKSAIDFYGWDNFIHEIVADGLTKSEACALEKELISEYKSNQREYGYNHSTGGENPAEGVVVSDETRKKQSIAHKDYKPTEATKIKISLAKKGRPNGRTGQTGILSRKSKIILQIDERTGEIVKTFYGYPDMVKTTGFARTPVRETALGIRKRAYGYRWEQAERGNKDVTF